MFLVIGFWFLNPEPKTRNPEPGTRNLYPEPYPKKQGSWA